MNWTVLGGATDAFAVLLAAADSETDCLFIADT